MSDWKDVESDWKDVSPEDDEFSKIVKQAGKDAVGGVDASISMLAGIPSYIYSGLSGIGELMLGNGIDAAGSRVTKEQERNFGLGPVVPFTESGKQAANLMGDVSEYLSEKAGDAGYAVGGELGRTNAQVVAGWAGAFAPIPGGKFVRKLGKGVERELGINQPEKAGSKVDKIDAKLADEGWTDVRPEGYEQGRIPMEEAVERKTQKMADNAIQGELDLRAPDMPIDENGMPYDPVKSLDVQEAGRLDQPDLFNEAYADQTQKIRQLQEGPKLAEEQQIRQQQMEQMYADRQRQLFQEQQDKVQAEKQAKLNDYLTEVEQKLRENQYTPKGDGQGPKTREFNRNRERGAVDIQELVDGFKALLDGKEVGYLKSNLTPEQSKMLGENANIDIVKVVPEVKGKGVGSELYKKWADAHEGRIAPSGKTTQDAWNVWKRNYPEKVDDFVKQEANRIRTGASPQLVIGNITDPKIAQRVLSESQTYSHVSNIPGQRGAIDLGSPEPKPGNKLSTLTSDSPEIAEAKKALVVDRQKAAMARLTGVEQYTTFIDTPEKVIALAGSARDLGPTQAFKAKTISPGMNAVAISSNNPLLRYTRDAISKTIRATEQITRQYVTGPESFATKMKRLSIEEQGEVVGALQKADRHQKELSPELLRETGFNEKQIDFIQHIQKMDQVKLDLWNKVREELGLPPVKNRMGHFAGNFGGDYRTLVYNAEKEIIGVIGTNTAWSNKMIQKKVLAKYPGASFADTKRSSLGGSGAKANIYAGFADMLGVLAKDDPRFAKIQEVIDAAIKDRGDSLYGASLHDKAKKGIWGNEGNKFWEDKNTNTKEALKSFVDYWESGIASHLNLPTEVRLKELMDNPALDHMPRAKEYVNDYINNFTGRNLGTVGDAINKLIDTPGRWAGIGPTLPREAITQFNKRASQMTMGFVNPLFMLTQYLQVGQMGVPELLKLRGARGLSSLEYSSAMSKAMSDGLKLANETLTGKKANVDSFTRDAYQYAKDNGLLEFSEYANARDIFQNKYSKAFDKVADDIPVIGRTATERATRPYVFFSAVNMLKDSGLSPKEVFDTAYNVTQHSMINYHASEKPLMYSKLGVLGQASGALQTFKHAYLGQLGTFIKDAAKGRPGPLLTALVAIGAYSGLKGVPFYQELDELVKYITDEYFHDRKGITDLALKNQDEWVKSGVLSAATGVNMQSRLSTADVLPNSIGEAVSPFGSWGVKTGKAILDLANNQDALAAKNLAVQLAPSGTAKGLVENAFKVNDKNQTINKTGEVDYQRTPFDSTLRKYTGGVSLQESLAKERIYNDLLNQKSRQDKQKEITKKAERLIAQDKLSQEALQKLAQEYIKEKGDPQQLVNALVEYAQSRNQTTKQRLQGVPNGGVSSVNKWKNYND